MRLCNRISMLITVAVLCLQLTAQAFQADSAATLASAAKVSILLKGCGHKYTKRSETVWTIEFRGKQISQRRLMIAAQQDMLVTMVVIARKSQMQVTPEFMQSLLRFNTALDRVKVGFDEEGDLEVRIDSTARTVDADDFREILNQMTAAADEVYAANRKFISD